MAVGAEERRQHDPGRAFASLRLARASEEAAFEEAFRRLYPRAVAVARRILGERQQAEDVAAEAFTKTYLRWRRVKDLPHLDGWVLRVTTNLALDEAKRRLRRSQKEASTGTSDSTIATADLIAIRTALVVALTHLPRRQRDAIALRYLSDLSEADTAAAMGVSPGTVKTHLHRGLDALRRGLGDTIEEELDVRPT